MSARPLVTKTACSNCHKRKVRCDYPQDRGRCVNCEVFGLECNPHSRKRKLRSIIQQAPETYFPTQSVSPCQAQEAPEEPEREHGGFPPAAFAPDASESRETRHKQDSPYVGRIDILGRVPFSERPRPARTILSTEDSDGRYRQVLRVFDAATCVSDPVATRLIGLFEKFCWPWAPVTEPSWLQAKGRTSIPLLLLQSVLLTGSRVSSIGSLGQSMDLYQKAKARFFYGDNRMPLASVISAILLQWWSPTGPEQFSLSNSGFWMHIAVGLAHQLGLHKEPEPGPHRGLRRRIWWTLVTRDILISVGVGRPRVLSLEDSDVSPPSAADFQEPGPHADLFVAYVEICRIMGEVAECRRRCQLNAERRHAAEESLSQWLHSLPPHLRLFTPEPPRAPMPYNLEARQLHVIFFVSLIILTNAEGHNTVAVTSLVASSFVAAIFAEFQENGDLQRLGPIFAFHGLAAGLPLLSAQKLRSVAPQAASDFDKIYSALEELAEKWGSARGLLEPLAAARHTARATASSDDLPAAATAAMMDIFSGFGAGISSLWWTLRCQGKTDEGRRGEGEEVDDSYRPCHGLDETNADSSDEDENGGDEGLVQDGRAGQEDDQGCPTLDGPDTAFTFQGMEGGFFVQEPWEMFSLQSSWPDDGWIAQVAETYGSGTT